MIKNKRDNSMTPIWAFFLLLTLQGNLLMGSTIELVNIDHDHSIMETGDGVYMELHLSSAQENDIEANINFVGSSALPDVDFQLKNMKGEIIPLQNGIAKILIPSGTLAKKFFICSLLDYIHEEDEQIKMTLEVINDIALSGREPHIIVIEDNDLSELENSVKLINMIEDSELSENYDGVYMLLGLSTLQSEDIEVTLDFSLSKALSIIDYKILDVLRQEEILLDSKKSVKIVIPAGTFSKKIFIQSIEDDLHEGRESINMKITSVSNGLTLGSSIEENLTIIDEDGAYHVSLDGDDSLNSGMKDAPFRTIKHAVPFLNAGETLIVHAGVYDDKNITIKKSGREHLPITIRAEPSNSVFLTGTRPLNKGQLQSSFYDTAFVIKNFSHIVIDGFYMKNFNYGVWIENNMTAGDITIKNSTFVNNADAGISNYGGDFMLVKNCTFISLIPVNGWNNLIKPEAIQDYGVSLYESQGSVIENSYFYGAHNQALSFKYGCHNCRAEKNIFSGNLYTALQLGQDYLSSHNTESTGLVVKNNIFRNTANYRLKNPITVNNVKNVKIQNNYMEGYGFFNPETSMSGIQVFKDARGVIEIEGNIIAFSKREFEGEPIVTFGIFIDTDVPLTTQVNIKNNIFYALFQEFYSPLDKSFTFVNNKIGDLTDLYFSDTEILLSTPLPLPLDTAPIKHNYNRYYKRLTESFFPIP